MMVNVPLKDSGSSEHCLKLKSALTVLTIMGNRVFRSRRRQTRPTVWSQRGPLVATLAVLLGGGVPLSIAALESSGFDVPGVDAPRSLMALVEDRSPGERTAAELTKTKAAKKLAEAPRQRALGKITKPREQVLPKSVVDAIVPPVPVVAAPTLPSAPSAPIVTAGLVPFSLTPPPGGGIIVPPPTGSTPPTNPPPPDTPQVPAVPEPGTWAMMLLGFGMVGWLMRRRPRTGAARSFA